ncbi:MAG: hypothetical protein VX519_00705 [Myxococcota bacterium]|nr:hypothetical protein [Myxococcota bacterium]
MIWLLYLCMTAVRADVIETVAGGEINWTQGVLYVRASAVPGPSGAEDFKTTEQAARHKLVATLQSLGKQVRVESDRLCIDLMANADASSRALEEGLKEGRGHWRVVETRYHASGRVELEAELSLVEWIRPALVGSGEGEREAAANPGRSSGLLVDARGLDVDPVFAPRLVSHTGEVLYDFGALSASRSVGRAPAMWVDDPVTGGLAKRVGASPLVLLADGLTRKGDLILSKRDSARVAAIAAGADLLAAAPVAIIVDPL